METASLLVFVRDRCLKQIHLIKEINEQGHFHYLMRSSSFFREGPIRAAKQGVRHLALACSLSFVTAEWESGKSLY